MLAFDSIIHSFGSKKVLRGIYLSVPPGSITGLFGFNGTGKSTLIRIGAGYITQDDGNVFIDGQSVSEYSGLKRFDNIGYLSQDTFIPGDLTVESFILSSTENQDQLLSDELLTKVRKQKVSTLSGGELRYLEVKFLFSLDRKYYLLDEPFTGIEPIIIEKISNQILRQKELEKGILVTDHYYRYLVSIIDKCYLLKDGYIKELDSNADFRKSLKEQGYLIR